MPLPLAVTMGDPAGIGGELTIDSWHAARAQHIPVFAALDDPDRIRVLADRIGRPLPIQVISDLAEAEGVFGDALPVLPILQAASVVPGQPSETAAPAILRSIRAAVELALAGNAAAVVTNPIAKNVLYRAGFSFPGHTEFLAALAGEFTDQAPPMPVMMIAGPSLRVVPLTIHIPLMDVSNALTLTSVVEQARIVERALRIDFGIPHPRLALAGLNPHAGEGGTLGMEEQSVLGPSVEALRADGIAISGPLSADTMFHASARCRYDAALCPTHDQALIPAKTLDFDQGVNVTLGLPFVRTSPDHGTAFDIAGRGIARPDSLIASLRQASAMAERRASYGRA